MKLKTQLRLIENAHIVALAGLFLAGLAFSAYHNIGFIQVFYFLLSIPLIGSFLCRNLLINQLLKRAPYKGVAYDVLDKIKLTEHLDIALTDELLDDLYKPSYTTEAFLLDNELKTEIFPSKWYMVYAYVMAAFLIGSIIYSFQKSLFQPWMIVVMVGGVAFSIFSLFKKPAKPSGVPILMLTKEALQLEDRVIPWKSIYDWEYYPGSRSSSVSITLHYYNPDESINSHPLTLKELDFHHIDLLMLITHFKAKAGQNNLALVG